MLPLQQSDRVNRTNHAFSSALQRFRDLKITSLVVPVHRVNFCASSSPADNTDSAETLSTSRFADTPWEYLKSEGKHE